MDNEEIFAALRDVDGVSEVAKVLATFQLYRQAQDGHQQTVTVDLLDYGIGVNTAYRYACVARADDGRTATGNPDSSVEMALMHMHWEHLDRPEPTT